MNIIVACDENLGIGNQGKLLCYLPEDLKYFKEKTNGKVVVMGRKTMESLPNGKPLKNRKNYVLTRNKDSVFDGFEPINGLGMLNYKLLEENIDSKDVWIIGGGEIYNKFLPICDMLYITEIESSFESDTYFPNFKKNNYWELQSRSKTYETKDGVKYSFAIYKRKKKSKKYKTIHRD